MKIILTKGLPSSGKTTWAKSFIQQNPEFIRVNKDDIRSMIGAEGGNKEKLVLELERALVKRAIEYNVSLIIDNTNLNPVHESFYRSLATAIDFEVKDFTHVPLSTCITRDNEREAKVGEAVIRGMHNKYIKK